MDIRGFRSGFVPVIYGVGGFVGGIISAAIYNLISGWVGGVKLELSQENTAEN